MSFVFLSADSSLADKSTFPLALNIDIDYKFYALRSI